MKEKKNEMMEQPIKYISRRSLSLFLVVAMAVCCAIGVSANEPGVKASDFQPVLDAITSQISVGTILGVIGIVLSACVGLVFMWWGVRKVVSMLMSAFKKGKISL